MRHRGALVWALGAAITSPEPGRPRVLFQRVPEPKTVKNRLHLDVRVGAERRREALHPLLAGRTAPRAATARGRYAASASAAGTVVATGAGCAAAAIKPATSAAGTGRENR